MNSVAVVQKRISLPRALAATSHRARSFVSRWLVHERVLRFSLDEIKRQLSATVPLHVKDKETGQWIQIGEKPDNRARAWAVDRILDLAGAYPPKEQPGDEQRDAARAKLRELIEQHKGEPVEVLKFRWETGRWPDASERAKLLNVPRVELKE